MKGCLRKPAASSRAWIACWRKQPMMVWRVKEQGGEKALLHDVAAYFDPHDCTVHACKRVRHLLGHNLCAPASRIISLLPPHRAALLVAYQRSSSTAQPNIMADRAERAYFEAVSPAQPASSLPSTAPSSSPGIPHAGDSTSTSTSRSSGSDLGPRSSVPDTIDQGGGPARPSNNPAHTQGDLPWTLRAGWWLVPPSARGGMGRQAEWSHR